VAARAARSGRGHRRSAEATPARRQLLVAHRPRPRALSPRRRAPPGAEEPVLLPVARHHRGRRRAHARAGTTVFVHHSAVSREERTLAEERFHHGTTPASSAPRRSSSASTSATSIASPGRGARHGVARSCSAWAHRPPRGQVANTTFFCETGDGVVQAIALIELAKRGWVESGRAQRPLLARAGPSAPGDVARRERRARPRRPGRTSRACRTSRASTAPSSSA
jgi:ATP-dependent Lhr-like helicase